MRNQLQKAADGTDLFAGRKRQSLNQDKKTCQRIVALFRFRRVSACTDGCNRRRILFHIEFKTDTGFSAHFLSSLLHDLHVNSLHGGAGFSRHYIDLNTGFHGNQLRQRVRRGKGSGEMTV